MARKSNNLDRKLLVVGRKLLELRGLNGFSLRVLSKAAGVNLGMITYHFGSKDAYLKALLFEVYRPFLAELGQLGIENSSDSEKLLRDQLMVISRFSRDNSSIILPLLTEVVSGNKVAIRFLKNGFTDHLKIFRNTLKIYLEFVGIEQKRVEPVFRYLVSTVVLSNLMAHTQGKLTKKLQKVTDRELGKLVEIALLGISRMKEI